MEQPSTEGQLENRTLPSRTGQLWSQEENASLLQQIREKVPTEEIARKHQRTENGIFCHLKQLAADSVNRGESIEFASNLTGLKAQEILAHMEKKRTKKAKAEKKEKKKPGAATTIVYDTDNESNPKTMLVTNAAIMAEIRGIKLALAELTEMLKAVFEDA